MEKRWVMCESQKWVCPHIVHLDRSVTTLTETFSSLINKITDWNTELNNDAQAIINALKQTLSLEDLKRTIADSTHWILEKQNAMMIEIQTLRKDVEKLQKDDLTWLYRREKYTQDFANLKKNLIENGKNFSCAVIDIDNFKKINDTHSHAGWDKVLQYLAEVLKTKFWVKHVYRYWWEEFMILYKGCKEKLEKWLNEVLNFLHSAHAKNRLSIQLTFSGWITECAVDDTSDSLFNKADRLMYQVKHNGKNRVITG